MAMITHQFVWPQHSFSKDTPNQANDIPNDYYVSFILFSLALFNLNICKKYCDYKIFILILL